MIERFTRTDMGTLRYEVTINDPGVYTRPWKSTWNRRWVPGEETPVLPVSGQPAVKERAMRILISALAIAFAITSSLAAQNPAPPGGGAGQGRAGGQGRGGGGGRGGAAAAPAAPTPRWPDGKPILGSVPGQPVGGWGAGVTTLPGRGGAALDAIPFQPWARAVYDVRQIDQFESSRTALKRGVAACE